MQQPFAHKVAAPSSSATSTNSSSLSGSATKDGKAVWLVAQGNAFDWFDENKTTKRGAVKLDSLMGVSREKSTLTVETATKSHVFIFNNEVRQQKSVMFSFSFLVERRRTLWLGKRFSKANFR
jgi:hypothetical protein